MFRTATDVATGFAARRADVRRMLVERRRELLLEIQSRIRDVREEGSSTDHHAPHLGEPLEAEPDEDLAFALIQMKAEMLDRVNEAVRTFDEGAYGSCLTVARSSARHGSKRCHLRCVAGSAKRVAKTSSTAIASNCRKGCQPSARECDARVVSEVLQLSRRVTFCYLIPRSNRLSLRALVS